MSIKIQLFLLSLFGWLNTHRTTASVVVILATIGVALLAPDMIAEAGPVGSNNQCSSC